MSQSSSSTDVSHSRAEEDIHALQARPLPDVPHPSINLNDIQNSQLLDIEEDWGDEYDYVALQDKLDDSESSKTEVANLSGLQRNPGKLDELSNQVPLSSEASFELNTIDKEMIRKLEIDVTELMQNLSGSIKKFFDAVDNGEPPYTFVALGKQVILSAHQMVFVGDILIQKLHLPPAENLVITQCEAMCAILKRTVAATKLAALQWPSTVAVQDMIDKMYDVVTCAQQIRVGLLQIVPQQSS